MKKHFILLSGLFYILSVFTSANAQIITTIAGNGTYGHSGGGGTAVDISIGQISGVAVDGLKNVYISDNDTNLYRYIRKITPSGIMTTIAGGAAGDSGDGGAATLAQFGIVSGLAVDNIGNLYIADEGACRVRKINTSGVISTVAGTGTLGYNGDGIPATSAQLNMPEYIAVDKNGNIYISDSYNSRIRKVDTSGIISTITGTGIVGYSGDNGPATAAQIDHPLGIAIDSSSNIYIADGNNRIRKINNSGTITTFAGTGVTNFSGDGHDAASAEFNYALNVAVDDSGNVYIDDFGTNDRIRRVNSSGIISTYVGNGTHGYSGDGGPATAAEINDVYGMATDKNGNLYFGDFWNYRVRAVVSPLATAKVTAIPSGVLVYPNPNSGKFTLCVTSTEAEIAKIEITDILGAVVYKDSVPTNKAVNINIDAPYGIYFLTASFGRATLTKQIVLIK
jgi:sugar lactone lactonase YvrE